MKQKHSSVSEHHIALYRKYRPSQFKDVLGQDHVVTVLEHAIKSNSISHAYIFAGTRGTGKTSIARIFARAIGSEGSDIYEIDAASNRGIDDVRSIRDSVHTLPFESKYKVYIIDEAHMLTKEAWNAFLKTLEEPPSYVVFMLATTEIEKIPETVLSRCQVFQFKKPSLSILEKVVSTIVKKEGREIDKEASELIAILGDGSFRDTQGILDTILSSTDTHIVLDDVARITGAPRSDLVHNFIVAVSQKKTEDALMCINAVVAQNVSISIWLTMVLQKMRFILLIKYGGIHMQQVVKSSMGEEEYKHLSDITDREGGITSLQIVKLLTCSEAVRNSSKPELQVELTVIDMLETTQV